jgi:hypothetical protein
MTKRCRSWLTLKKLAGLSDEFDPGSVEGEQFEDEEGLVPLVRYSRTIPMIEMLCF